VDEELLSTTAMFEGGEEGVMDVCDGPDGIVTRVFK